MVDVDVRAVRAAHLGGAYAHTVGDRLDRRALARREVDTLVHATPRKPNGKFILVPTAKGY